MSENQKSSQETTTQPYRHKPSWERESSDGKGFLWLLMISIVIGILVIIGFVSGWFSGKSDIPQAELKAKYELCKSTSDEITAITVTISSLEKRKVGIENANKKKPQAKWSKKVKADYNLLLSQINSLKAKYDSLSNMYNTEMAKLNWRFTKPDSLPADKIEILPRELEPILKDKISGSKEKISGPSGQILIF
ncbi:MAG: hypothetical protein QMD65_00865 [Patescibacteria group bacterium]|nr:hypothetical protein [Patescibacteria group bacterium]